MKRTLMLLMHAVAIFVICDSRAIAYDNPLNYDNLTSGQIKMYISLDRQYETGDGKSSAEYIQGMSALLRVGLVNIASSQNRSDAKKIYLQGDWPKHLRVVLKSGNNKPKNIIFRTINKDLVATKTTELYMSNMYESVVIDSLTLYKYPEGHYTITSFLGPVQSNIIDVYIKDMKLGDDVYIGVGKAWISFQEGRYREALNEANTVMNKYGRMAHDKDKYVILISALSQENLDNLKESLELLEEYQNNYVPRSQREDISLVRMKIAELKERLKTKKENKQ